MVNGCGDTVNAASTTARRSEAAEQVAIAMALADNNLAHVYSESFTALEASQRGTVCTQAHKILTSKPINRHVVY